MDMKVKVSNCRVSPQKAQLVANIIRGKQVAEAYEVLQSLTNKSAFFFRKLVRSAIANIENNLNSDISGFYIKEISVNKGRVLRRVMPRAKGRADRISKRYAHLNLKLSEKVK